MMRKSIYRLSILEKEKGRGDQVERKKCPEKRKKEKRFSFCQEFFLIKEGKEERFFDCPDRAWEKGLFLRKKSDPGESPYGLERKDALFFHEGKISLALRDFDSVGELEERAFQLFIPLQEELKKEGLILCPLGVDPFSSFSFPPSLEPKERARKIRAGTGGLYFGLPFEGEEDWRKKRALAEVLSPILAALFDHAPVFEKKPSPVFALRQELLRKAEGAFREKSEQKVSMVISSMDALPLSYAFGAAALLLGLFASEENEEKLKDRLLPSCPENTRRGKDSARDNGIRGYYLSDYFVNWGMDFLNLAQEGLKKEDRVYLVPLKNLWSNLEAPRDLPDFPYSKMPKEKPSSRKASTMA